MFPKLEYLKIDFSGNSLRDFMDFNLKQYIELKKLKIYFNSCFFENKKSIFVYFKFP